MWFILICKNKRLKYGNPKQYNCVHCMYATTKKDILSKWKIMMEMENYKQKCIT